MNNLNEKTFDLLNATGLNWTVSKESLTTIDGKERKVARHSR
jgi:hypothetical protein